MLTAYSLKKDKCGGNGMILKKWLKKTFVMMLTVSMFVGLLHYVPQADDVVNLVLNYQTTVYTRQIYSPEVTQINSGIDTDSVMWVTDTCNHVAYITNGTETIDTASVVAAVKSGISAGGKNISLDLTAYTTKAIAEKAAETAAAATALQGALTADTSQSSAVTASQIGMTPELALSLNKLGIDTMISECSTKYTVGQDRSKNIAVAAGRVNGVMLQPGQMFSYDNTILPRTTANGYGPGDIISDGTHVKATGGGICQVSSTLNNAVLRAGIIPTERHNHSQRVFYLKSGLDATVSSGSMDYQFVNTLQYPIYICATAVNGVLSVSFYSNRAALNGMSYQTEVSGSDSRNSTYIVGYLNGAEISRVKAYSSSYGK